MRISGKARSVGLIREPPAVSAHIESHSLRTESIFTLYNATLVSKPHWYKHSLRVSFRFSPQQLQNNTSTSAHINFCPHQPLPKSTSAQINLFPPQPLSTTISSHHHHLTSSSPHQLITSQTLETTPSTHFQPPQAISQVTLA